MKANKAQTKQKFEPQKGRMPTLQFQLPSELRIDPSYQRSIDNQESQKLISKIAAKWNWDLCLPLVVARRTDGGLYVIDGQHRLEAAKMRGDIVQLPCVVVNYDSAADEAANFVQLNQARRPLSKLEVFKAAIASEDPEAIAIVRAIERAGLAIAPHSNPTAWKPGDVSNIGGIEAAWRNDGEAATAQALIAMAKGFDGQILTYAGTIFPGIVAVCADEMKGGKRFEDKRVATFINMLGLKSQTEWRTAILQLRVELPNLNFPKASAETLRRAWKRASAAVETPCPPPSKPANPAPIARQTIMPPVKSGPMPANGPRWCSQCEQRVSPAKAASCSSAFCKVKDAA